MMNFERKQKLLKILKSNGNLSTLCCKIKELTALKSNEEVETIIKSLNLPLREHLFILGNYSDLMSFEYGGQ